MKVCTICKIQKETSEFNRNKIRSDGLNNICRQCSNKRSRLYYQENREDHKKNMAIRKKRNREINQKKLLDILIGRMCSDCGTKDYRVFEFDHVSGDKVNNISQLIAEGYSWKVVTSEIEKCEVVCANCHRIRTFTRQGNYRIAL
jgi:protein-arginine kinase activator protein McsA